MGMPLVGLRSTLSGASLLQTTPKPSTIRGNIPGGRDFARLSRAPNSAPSAVSGLAQGLTAEHKGGGWDRMGWSERIDADGRATRGRTESLLETS